jgi:hypothetical protein
MVEGHIMEERSIRNRYYRAEGYRVVAVNGALGVIAAQDVIVADLYVERMSMPSASVPRPNEQGTLAPEEFGLPTGECVLERESQVGLMLSPSAARAIGEWLIGKADEYEQMMVAGGDRIPEHREPDLDPPMPFEAAVAAQRAYVATLPPRVYDLRDDEFAE